MQTAVVVTGASTGIGADAAEAIARAGYIVFAGVRNDTAAERIGSVHENIRPLRLDVTDRVSIDDAVRTVSASGIALRGVVNNAGIAVGGPIEHLPLDALRRQFDVNVFGAIAVTQAFLPLMHEDGRVIFVGSIQGRLTVPYIGPYSASKHALRALATALRIELAPAHIWVSLIEPGSVKTPIWSKGRASKDEMLASLPPGARAHYPKAIDSLVRQTENEERTGLPVERVTKDILHALTARKPRANYIVGMPARIGSFLSLLPAPLYDRLFSSMAR